MELVSETRTHAIAVAQAAAVVDDVDQNLATLASLVADARAQGADVVVTTAMQLMTAMAVPRRSTGSPRPSSARTATNSPASTSATSSAVSSSVG